MRNDSISHMIVASICISQEDHRIFRMTPSDILSSHWQCARLLSVSGICPLGELNRIRFQPTISDQVNTAEYRDTEVRS